MPRRGAPSDFHQPLIAFPAHLPHNEPDESVAHPQGGSRMNRRLWIGILSLLIATSVGLAGSSNSLMDVAPNGKALIVANNDNGTVTLVDLVEYKMVREIKVGKKP